jgi:peptidyl-prolyl cis-trans isomerase C
VTRTLSAVLATALVVTTLACRKPAAAAAQQTGTSGQAAAQTPEPPKPVPAQLPDVLARVNGEAVMKADFDRLIKNMEMRAGQPVPAERRDEIFRGALDQLVTYTVLAQESKARKVAVADSEIDEQLKQMKAQFPDEATFTKALAERGLTVDRLREDARREMGIQKMMDAEVANQPAPTDAQVREFYDKNPDKFEQPESLRASHILIRADQNADEATKKKARAQAEAVLEKAKAGGDFAALAKQHSADGSAQQGGDLGFFPRGQMVPAFEQAAFALKDGEISGIVETQFGYHIIKATERKAASKVPLEQVSDRIKEFLTEQHKQDRAEAFVAELKKKARIEVLI